MSGSCTPSSWSEANTYYQSSLNYLYCHPTKYLHLWFVMHSMLWACTTGSTILMRFWLLSLRRHRTVYCEVTRLLCPYCTCSSHWPDGWVQWPLWTTALFNIFFKTNTKIWWDLDSLLRNLCIALTSLILCSSCPLTDKNPVSNIHPEAELSFTQWSLHPHFWCFINMWMTPKNCIISYKLSESGTKQRSICTGKLGTCLR